MHARTCPSAPQKLVTCWGDTFAAARHELLQALQSGLRSSSSGSGRAAG